MTLCEPTVQHFLLLAHSYSHRRGLSVCHNHTSVCSKTSTAPLERHSWDLCKQPAFCWVQFLQNGKFETRSSTSECSSICGSLKTGRSSMCAVFRFCFGTLLLLPCFSILRMGVCSPQECKLGFCWTWCTNGKQSITSKQTVCWWDKRLMLFMSLKKTVAHCSFAILSHYSWPLHKK